jgi:hypothetical protein
MPDLWSLITGIVGLLSFLLAITEKFSELRKYTAPAAFFLLGFALGRVTYIELGASSGEETNLIVPSILIGSLIILTVVSYLFVRIGQDLLAYVIFFMGATTLPMKMVDSYKSSTEYLTYYDYIYLAQYKTSKHDFDSAIRLFKIAIDKTDSEIVKKELEGKIKDTYKRSVSGLTKQDLNDTTLIK